VSILKISPQSVKSLFYASIAKYRNTETKYFRKILKSKMSQLLASKRAIKHENPMSGSKVFNEIKNHG